MSYVNIWVHLVFSTKNRCPYLEVGLRRTLCQHILENCREKNILLKFINGHVDHIHCLVSLGKEQTIAQVAQQIKGESSHWINQNFSLPAKFAWQDDYFAVSVSQSLYPTVLAYIKNQEEHHKNKLFVDELREFNEKYGFPLPSVKTDGSKM